MGELIKNKLILILAITTAVFFLGSIGSCNNIRRSRSAYQREMATRLDLEERMSKFTQEKEAAEAKINKLSKDLEAEQSEHQATKKVLMQEQALAKSLKEELGKVSGAPQEKLEGTPESSTTAKSGNSK
ncbi:MAG: hypothetical protein HZA27_04910 [Candidatus Omnitrophica bacterium]|nr:hypothetical protein [Candidatus Omnitrophota bacterium]